MILVLGHAFFWGFIGIVLSTVSPKVGTNNAFHLDFGT